MRVALSNPLDIRKEVKLIVDIPCIEHEEWRADITSALKTFEGFASAGGLPPVIDWDYQCEVIGTVEYEQGGLICSWPSFPFGTVGVVMMLRMLGNLRRGKAQLTNVALTGTATTAEGAVVLKSLEEMANRLPAGVTLLPFQLTLCPSASWINIECEFQSPFPDELPTALHAAIMTWCNVANAGGFQIESETEGTANVDSFGVGMDEPVVGENFVQWHCPMAGVPPSSLTCLVNVLAYFSNRNHPIFAVYIG